MLVYSQNGERLAAAARLSVAAAVARLRRQHEREVAAPPEGRVSEPAYSREETSKYTDLMPDGMAREFTFYMEAKSIITRPSGGQKLRQPGFHEITGIAWSGHGKIKRVDVSVDGGKNWHGSGIARAGADARADAISGLPWQWDGTARVVIQSRAVDETGYVQPTFAELLAVRGENSFYHNNAIQPWAHRCAGSR